MGSSVSDFSDRMAERSTTLPSKQWSCSEISKGAHVCADLAGLSFVKEPHELDREDLLRCIEDWFYDVASSFELFYGLCILDLKSSQSLRGSEGFNEEPAEGTLQL